MSTTLTESQPSVRHPSFREAFRFWLKLGFISFGGPSGQIAMMHAELVEKKRWIDNARFLHALNFCMLLPGPEAQQLAIYIGWLLHKTRGGVVAGALFVIPSIFILWALSYVYVAFGNIPWIAAIFYGLKPAVTRHCCRGCHSHWKQGPQERSYVVARVGSHLSQSIFSHVPFPVIIISAGIRRTSLARGFWPNIFDGESAQPLDVGLVISNVADRREANRLHALKISATWIVIGRCRSHLPEFFVAD